MPFIKLPVHGAGDVLPVWLCGALILGKTWGVQAEAGAGSGDLPLPPNSG